MNDEKDDNIMEDEVEDDDVAEEEVGVDDVEDDEVKGEEDDDVEEEDRSQDRDPHFARACTIEMHMDVAEEPHCVRSYRKVPGPRTAQLF